MELLTTWSAFLELVSHMAAIPWGLPYKKDESGRRTFKRLKSGFSTYKPEKKKIWQEIFENQWF